MESITFSDTVTKIPDGEFTTLLAYPQETDPISFDELCKKFPDSPECKEFDV